MKKSIIEIEKENNDIVLMALSKILGININKCKECDENPSINGDKDSSKLVCPNCQKSTKIYNTNLGNVFIMDNLENINKDMFEEWNLLNK